jgi:hypothetical protein
MGVARVGYREHAKKNVLMTIINVIKKKVEKMPIKMMMPWEILYTKYHCALSDGLGGLMMCYPVIDWVKIIYILIILILVASLIYFNKKKRKK